MKGDEGKREQLVQERGKLVADLAAIDRVIAIFESKRQTPAEA